MFSRIPLTDQTPICPDALPCGWAPAAAPCHPRTQTSAAQDLRHLSPSHRRPASSPPPASRRPSAALRSTTRLLLQGLRARGLSISIPPPPNPQSAATVGPPPPRPPDVSRVMAREKKQRNGERKRKDYKRFLFFWGTLAVRVLLFNISFKILISRRKRRPDEEITDKAYRR